MHVRRTEDIQYVIPFFLLFLVLRVNVFIFFINKASIRLCFRVPENKNGVD